MNKRILTYALIAGLSFGFMQPAKANIADGIVGASAGGILLPAVYQGALALCDLENKSSVLKALALVFSTGILAQLSAPIIDNRDERVNHFGRGMLAGSIAATYFVGLMLLVDAANLTR